MNENQNGVNQFLDGLDAMNAPDPFASAQATVVPSSPEAPQVPMQAPVSVTEPNGGQQPIAPAATWPTEQPQPIPQAASVTPAQDTPTVQPATQPVAQPTAPAVQPQTTTLQPETTGTQQGVFDPFEQAKQLAESQQNDRMLEAVKQKRPFFSYGKVKDEIENTETTFEDLRAKYETDFPEFSGSKKLSWSVSYGKVNKPVSNPASDKVYKIKEEIEKSKNFLDALKNAKTDADKNPECLVKVVKKAGSKGEVAFPAYKVFKFTRQEAENTDASIVVLPSKDGRLFELRKNEIGTFTTAVNKVKEFEQLRNKFTFSLPKIPMEILQKVMSFFKQLSDKYQFEALVHILYDKENKEYVIKVPKQKISHISVNHELDEPYPENFIHVMDIHSHNSMPAVFSEIDNDDEKETRLYAVAGRFDRAFPELTVRAGCAGNFIDIKPCDVFDITNKDYPKEWESQIEISAHEKFALDDMKPHGRCFRIKKSSKGEDL